MNLTFLGSGTQFCTNEFHNNILIENDEQTLKLLIDCGSDIRFSLKEQNIDPLSITDVIITHIHGDHVGGLEWLGFFRHFCDPQNVPKPFLYSHPYILDRLWNETLKGSMQQATNQLMNLNNYFIIGLSNNSCNDSFHIIRRNIIFHFFQQWHITTDLFPIPNFGIEIKTPRGQKILFSSDCNYQSIFKNMNRYYEADIIFQDCDLGKITNSVHANYQELIKLPKMIKSKMNLMHTQKNLRNNFNPIRDGFQNNFIQKGQIFHFK
jgi:ribonuclease BN (tRNA processing enzyme)